MRSVSITAVYPGSPWGWMRYWDPNSVRLYPVLTLFPQFHVFSLDFYFWSMPHTHMLAHTLTPFSSDPAVTHLQRPLTDFTSLGRITLFLAPTVCLIEVLFCWKGFSLYILSLPWRVLQVGEGKKGWLFGRLCCEYCDKLLLLLRLHDCFPVLDQIWVQIGSESPCWFCHRKRPQERKT